MSTVVSTSKLAPDLLLKSQQPIRSQISKLTQLLTVTTTHKFPLQEQLAKFSSDSLSRLGQDGLSRLSGLSGAGQDGLSRLSGLSGMEGGLSRLSGDRLTQAQDSLARISSMTNSISPPQSSSHSSHSPGK